MRKFLTALVAVAAIGATAVATSSTADARGWGRWLGRGGWGYGGWGYGGWGLGLGAFIAGALIGGALAAPYYYRLTATMVRYPYGPYPVRSAAGACGTVTPGCAPAIERSGCGSIR